MKKLFISAAAIAFALAQVCEAADRLPDCPEGRDVAIWTSPSEPRADQALRVLAVAERDSASELVVTGPDGRPLVTEIVRLGGPPWSLGAAIPRATEGSYRIEVRDDAAPIACRNVVVNGRHHPSAPAVGERALVWDRRTEDFYSAWIEWLFDAPMAEALDFPSLEAVLRDEKRNFLHDHLHLGEDDPRGPRALRATPDCADLPYFLRAYFAWKIGLPMGVRSCGRGTATAPPRCGSVVVTAHPGDGGDRLSGFTQYARRLMDTVQSGAARTALDDDATDFYPLPLARDAIRPGAIYADPFGHTLVVVKWVPQTAERAGLLLAVDAQPDHSVARKRFWEGTFLFATDSSNAGPGFKAFRPIVRDAGGEPRPMTNAMIATDARFVPFSDQQAQLTADQFYARMSALIDPHGLDPVRAYEETLDALVEQLETRVASVDHGERYMREHPSPALPMPEGARIFESEGPWEDFSTPSRDMRLIIAIKVLTGMPERIVRHPNLYVLSGSTPAEARGEVAALHDRRIHDRTVRYTRSDGTSWTLTVADVIDRMQAFEIAYNPNDCVEIRWGATEGSDEYAPCHKHAPAEQRARMAAYRSWFREGRRPPR